MGPLVRFKSDPMMGSCTSKNSYDLGADVFADKSKTTNFVRRLIDKEQTVNNECSETLEGVLSKCELPMTVRIKKDNSILPDDGVFSTLPVGEVFTVNHKQTYTILQCIKDLKEEVSIYAESACSVRFLSIDNTEVYNTLSAVRDNKKTASITWFVATKEFSVNQTLYSRGQIFTFVSNTLQHSMSRSFKRERQKGITVQTFPNMKRCFLPLCAYGEFRKCDPPSFTQRSDLCELAKSENLPYMIFYDQTNTSETESCQYVYQRTTVEVLFMSQKVHGVYKLHAVSSRLPLQFKVLPSASHVDVLDQPEIEAAIKCYNFPSTVEELYKYYEVRAYKQLGITRLLDEIFVELNQKIVTIGNNDVTSIKSIDYNLTDKNSDPASLQINQNLTNQKPSRKTSTVSLGPYLKVGNSISNTSQQLEVTYLTGIEKDTQDDEKRSSTRQSSHIYVNECPLSDQVMPTSRELIVKFDDGGYVIIPFFGRAPKISLDKEIIEYKSRINSTYGYSSIEELSEEKEHDPIYSYISASSLNLNELLTDHPHTQDCFTSGRHRPKARPYSQKYWELDNDVESHLKTNNRMSNISTATENRYSFSYDYPHMGYFRMPRDIGRQHISRLTIEEVGDLLKINLMKHHITIFQKHSVNGPKLSTLSEEKLTELKLTRFEARKLKCFVNGWRPLHSSARNDLWLAKVPSDWSVFDLSRYLLHINMRSFQRFASRHTIDGFLLIELLKDDIFESISQEHSIMFCDKDVERLRKYVSEDGQPKFKYVRT